MIVFVPKPMVLVYYSNLVKRRRAPELIFRIAVSEFCVFALVSLLFAVLFGGPASFSSDFTSVEDATSLRLLLPLPEGVQNFV